MINLILLKDFKTLGKKGNKIKVKYGYALNYLIPKKIASFLTKENFLKFKNKEQTKIKNDKINIENFDKLINKIKIIKTFNINVKSDKNGNLFGSVNFKNILNIINKIQKINLEKKNIIILNKKINKIGIYKVLIKKYNKEILFYLNVI